MTSHNQRKSSLVGGTGCSFQFGRTSILLPRPPHLPHFSRLLTHGTSVSAGLARHVDQRLMAAGVVEAEGDQVLHAQLAHVAERHRRAG